VSHPDDLVAELWREVRPHQIALTEELVTLAGHVVAHPDDLASWRDVRRITHRLAGTLGSFGQQNASDAALTLEELIGGVERPEGDLPVRTLSLAEAVLAALTADD
jgi:chemotaxis protein histidine kinase CheA